ncbi:MAG: hypothetical protein KDA24_02620 [Deltaproteobacteria bacterium]|nr:hypothetical protein [Deltaproteobacteria bacterium]
MPRKLELDLLVDGEPEEVAERLKEETRWSPQPYRGGPLTFGKKPLKGRVAEGKATVGLNKSDWWSMLQPTASVTLDKSATGTRIQGHVGMPDFMVWTLRLVAVLFMPLVVGVSTLSLLGEGTASAAMIAAAFAAFALLVTVLGLGAHVHHANEQVDELRDQLVTSAGGRTLLSTDVAETELPAEVERELEEARARPQGIKQ